MPDPVTAERLVRLRVLLAGALAAATDQTPTGRHVSVIFLDGVCELALHLAADEHDIDVTSKHGFEDVYSMIAGSLGSGWNRRSAKGVRELHRARNNLQHHGILPDAEHLPLWTSEADRFVHSLVRAAFGEDLAAVRAAEAVEDDELRDPLTSAEAAMATGDFAASVQESKRAVDVAVRRFRSVRGSSSFSRFGHNVRRFDEFRKIDQAFDSIENFVDIAYLATDPGEWLWLRRIAEDSAWSTSPSQDDARRAFNFALAWILRFEAFAARLPRRVYREVPQPSLDEPYKVPGIVKASLAEDEVGARDTISLHLTLSDVPPGWLDLAYRGLNALRETESVPEGLWATSAEEGIVVHLPQSTDPNAVRWIAEELVRQTHNVFEQQLEARRQHRALEVQTAARYADVLLSDERGWVTSVTAEIIPDRPALLRAQVNLPDSPATTSIEAALNQARAGPGGTYVSIRDNELLFSADTWEPEAVLPALEQAIVKAAEADRTAAEERRAADEQRRRLLQGARRAFADLAEDTNA